MVNLVRNWGNLTQILASLNNMIDDSAAGLGRYINLPRRSNDKAVRQQRERGQRLPNEKE